MTQSSMEKKNPLPPLLAEKDALGELSKAEERFVTRRISSVEREANAEALNQANQEFLATHSPRLVAGEIRRRLHEEGKGWRRLGLWSGGAFALLTAMLLMIVQPWTPPGEDIRIKGMEPRIEVYRKLPDGFEWIASGVDAAAGDLLQIRYVAAGEAFGVLLSIDGHGTVTRHLPAQGEEAATLEQGGEVALDHSYELDDAPKFERFVLVTSDRPFAVKRIEDALKDLSKRGLEPSPETLSLDGESFKVVTFEVRKSQ